MAIEPLTGNTIIVSLPTKSVAKDANNVQQDSGRTGSADTIAFTNTSQDLKTAMTAGAATPVINEDRVAAIKLAIQSGTYKPDAARIATKMLQFEAKLPNTT